MLNLMNRAFLRLEEIQLDISDGLEALESAPMQPSTSSQSESGEDFITSCSDAEEARTFALSIIEFECSLHKQENDGIDLTVTVEPGDLETKMLRLAFTLSKEGERGSISYTVRVYKSDDGTFHFFGDQSFRELVPTMH